MTIYIRDDNGHAWYYQNGRISSVLGDLDPDSENENGYYCDSFEDGIKLLNDEGYITGDEYDKNNTSDMEYFTA